MENKKNQINFRLTPTLNDRLKRQAQKEYLSVSMLLTKIATDYLKSQEGK